MAHLFSRVYSGSFSIATVNFNLRGDESDDDELLVRNWAEENGIRCFSKSFDTASFAGEKGISTQMAARELRYRWFDSLISEHGFDFLATAHNLNDSVETLFINLVRGTGIKGMTGIKEKNGYVIRPLLTFSRSEIAGYVKFNDVPFREDSTNAQSHYSRNRIRNMIFPELEMINPSYLSTIERSMSNVRAAVSVIDELFREKREYLTDNDGMRISVDRLIREKRADYWLYMLLDDYGFNFDQIKQITDSLHGQPGKEFHSESHVLIKDREWLLLYPKGCGAVKREILLESMTCGSSITVERGDRKICFSLYSRPDGFRYTKRLSKDKVAGVGDLFHQGPAGVPEPVAFLDYDKLSFPLVIREWRSGDKFIPLGMKGYKKVSDYLVDIKVDKVSKNGVSVLISDGEIVALPGYRIGEKFRITSSTVNILEISIS
jgi:tRNA(Ile)-lysidine synthase